ncbi:MAG: SOUL family heme-binding protein [Rubrimonas sp.]
MLIWIAAALGLAAVGVVGGWAVVTSNVEEPPFVAVVADGDFALRDYPALVVAEVERAGDRAEAVRAGFSPLAGYIFARERPGEKIAMTAPVTQERAGDRWIVRFIMPAGRDLASLPAPAAGGPVALRELPPARRAVVRFAGVADDALLAEQTVRLRAWIEARGLTPAEAPPVFAYYNDPFTPGFLRRNEVMIAIEP